jgi:predicted AAA+ superfamily ATPase
MNISRRKVRKYSEILLKYQFIEAIWPFAPDESKELSRHVKVYFTDLSFLCGALGVAYYHGSTKQWVLENFIFLELQRKLAKTHDIRFYRKKSGADIPFILVEKETEQLTPIIVTTKSTDIIPAALKSFDESYHDHIEHSMILNDDRVEKRDFEGKTLLILPHVAI